MFQRLLLCPSLDSADFVEVGLLNLIRITLLAAAICGVCTTPFVRFLTILLQVYLAINRLLQRPHRRQARSRYSDVARSLEPG